MKLLRSRHAEYLVMSTILPIMVVGGIWLLDASVVELRSPGVTIQHLIATTTALFIMVWWVMSIATLSQVPGYGKYAFYIFILPVATIIINCFLDNNHATLMGLDMEVLAVIGVTILTWFGSIVVCVIDWYKFNHAEFTLIQDKLK